MLKEREEKMNDNKTKEIKELLDANMEEFVKVNKLTEDWKKYYRKNYYIVKYKDGFIQIERGRIKTRFCYGAGMYGRCDDNEWNSANNHASKIKQDQAMFIEENFDNYSIAGMMRTLKNEDDRCLTVQTQKNYNNSYKITVNHEYKNLTASYFYDNWGNVDNGFKKLSDKDLNNVFSVMRYAIEDFKSRLATYLKRFGLSKVYSWTYIVD